METVTEQAPVGSSVRDILKSTSLIGGASVLTILIGMVRTKLVAVLLGPGGVGFLGLYSQLTTLASTISGLGISNSGVRQVAQAVGTNDQQRIARTVVTLRRTCWITGAIGMLVMAALAIPISLVTFGDRSQAWPVALLSVTVLLTQIAAGQACLLRGTRRIGDVARISVLGSLSSTLVGLPCYLLWGVQGIVAALTLSALSVLGVSWWYARRVPMERVALPWSATPREARDLLSLGLSFMGASLLATTTTYAIQTILFRRFGVAGLGIYQAAYSLSGSLAGFVLGAMAADFYPRLTAVAGDDESVLRMLNEQAQAATLFALPGLAAIMVLAPVIIRLFFAADFAAAVPILRWCTLGVLGRVLSWPLGFVLLAKSRGRLYLLTEAFAAALHLVTLTVFTDTWHLAGSGIAFAALYVAYTVLMLVVVGHLLGSAWTAATARLNLFGGLALVLLLLNATLNPSWFLSWMFGGVSLLGVTWFCLRRLMAQAELSTDRFLPLLRKVFWSAAKRNGHGRS